MSNFLEKTLQFGLGLAAYSREKIEELVEEMVRRGEVAGKDARKLADELVEKARNSGRKSSAWWRKKSGRPWTPWAM